jgi:hypothetical protein
VPVPESVQVNCQKPLVRGLDRCDADWPLRPVPATLR